MNIKLSQDDKARFSRSEPVKALKIPIKLIQTFIKSNQAYLCNKPVYLDKMHV